MNRKWINVKDAIAIVIIAILSFFVESTIGLVLIPLISIPLVGGLLSGFVDAMIVFLGGYLVPRRLGPLLFGIILLSLSTITPSFGPPGAYKIIIGFGLGLSIDLLLLIIGRKPWSYIIATGLTFGGSIPMTYIAWEYWGISTTALKPYLFPFIGAYFVLGVLGSSFSYWIYRKRLSRFSLILNLRNG